MVKACRSLWKTDFFCGFWDHFWMLFRVRILGRLRDHILVILDLFWGPFLETILLTFGVPFLDRFSEDFRGSPKVKAGWSGR